MERDRPCRRLHDQPGRRGEHLVRTGRYVGGQTAVGQVNLAAQAGDTGGLPP